MDSHKGLFCLFLVVLLSGKMGLQAEARLHRHQHKYHPKILFVFGDSYADTGNTREDLSSSWKVPYGISYPGKPAGRFSDGRVLTDFIAKYLGVESPVPYRLRKQFPRHFNYGMNFAVGGTGVFDTSTPALNMTTQIDLFQQLIKEKVYTTSDLSNSVALLSVAGNDYSQYLATNGSAQGFPSFIASVVNQINANLIRIQGLGVKKIAVGGLPPLGCIPQTTAQYSFQQCNSTFNNLTLLHNNLLDQAVAKLNQETKDHTTFLILDLYDSFMLVLNHTLTPNIQNQFKPCCVGVSREYNCGSVDENKVKKYKVCDNPKSAFFWDRLHPTQAGWYAVYNKLRNMSALQQLQY